jgi:GntR family transcriptional repressor for pyruvate dehydrogenase complex
MSAAHAIDDVRRFVEADLAFHGLILQASGNVFVSLVFEPLSNVLTARRAQTSRVEQIRANAIHEHVQVMGALASGDPELARLAMGSHMSQTMNDLKTYILHIQ